MDTEDINYLEEYFYKTNLRFYKEIMSKIKKDFSNISVGDLTDYFDITQELKNNMTEYLSQKKEENKLKNTFKNHK